MQYLNGEHLLISVRLYQNEFEIVKNAQNIVPS
jgi:hypothetical protein